MVDWPSFFTTHYSYIVSLKIDFAQRLFPALMVGWCFFCIYFDPNHVISICVLRWLCTLWRHFPGTWMTVCFRQGDMFDHTHLHNLHCRHALTVAVWTAGYVQTCTKHTDCSVLLCSHKTRITLSGIAIILPKHQCNALIFCWDNVYTHEGSGHCLLKFSNSTGSIKVIKWTNCYTPLSEIILTHEETTHAHGPL